MHQKSSRATDDIQSNKVYRKPTNQRQDIRHIHTQLKDTLARLRISKFTIPDRRNKKQLMEMEKINWKIQLSWVKAHVGIQGNELAETLAKEAATNSDIKELYKIVPKSVVISELGKISVV